MLEQKRRSIHSKAGEQLFTSFNARGEDPRIDSWIVECWNFDIDNVINTQYFPLELSHLQKTLLWTVTRPQLELQTIHRFLKSWRRPLLGPSTGWKFLNDVLNVKALLCRRFQPGDGPSLGHLRYCESRWIVCSSTHNTANPKREIIHARKYWRKLLHLFTNIYWYSRGRKIHRIKYAPVSFGPFRHGHRKEEKRNISVSCTYYDYYVLYNTTNTIIHNTINKSPWPVLAESRSDQINLHVWPRKSLQSQDSN